MHDCPGWSQWLAAIVIFTVAILWSRPQPKKKHWYFVEMTYFSRNGIAVLKSGYVIALDRNGRTANMRTLKKMAPPVRKWESWAQLKGRYQNGNLVVSQFSYLGYFAENQ
jgi:hypothetical protein